jgi:hypothetical protein
MSTVWGRRSPQSSDSPTRRWNERTLMRTSPRGYVRFETSRLTLYGRPSAATANQDSLGRRRKALGSLRNARATVTPRGVEKDQRGGPCSHAPGRTNNWLAVRARERQRSCSSSTSPNADPASVRNSSWTTQRAHMAELLARRFDSRLSGKTIRRGGVRDRQSAPPAPDVRNGHRRTEKGA